MMRDTRLLESWLLGVAAPFGVVALVLSLLGEPSLAIAIAFAVLATIAFGLQSRRLRR